ncbi:MAG: shikimate dehydrogenase [candidate division KSB1 bacterium]|nr:shikimate dehydrogenase [candidate division KSB1 bacterium]
MADAHTQTLGLIGDPVDHSLSPLLHGNLIHVLGVNCCYHAFRVRREELAEAVAGLRALGVRGVNVTIPHKEAVLPLLDEVSPEARAVGAVNVIVNQQGRLLGYNSDTAGVELALRRRGVDVRGCKVVVLGAGGAARAVVWVLAQMGAAAVHIHSRTPTRGERLASELAESCGKTELTVFPWEEAALARSLEGAALLVNATPCGMWPRHHESPVTGNFLGKGIVVFDLVYNPLHTRLLREAAGRGAQTIPGLDMLIFQAVEAMALWTGRRPAKEGEFMTEMRTFLSKELQGYA